MWALRPELPSHLILLVEAVSLIINLLSDKVYFSGNIQLFPR